MDSDRTAPDLSPIEHQIVCLCAHALRAGFKYREVLVDGCGEGMVARHPSVLVCIELKQRKVDDREHVPFARRNPIFLPSPLNTRSPQLIDNGIAIPGNLKDDVALVSA